MEPRHEEPRKKRFRLVKLEERVVPAVTVFVGTTALTKAPPHTATVVDFDPRTQATAFSCVKC